VIFKESEIQSAADMSHADVEARGRRTPKRWRTPKLISEMTEPEVQE